MQWRFERPSVLTWLVAAMIVLLPVLAVLQFRWLGQLSDAERERLQRNLRATTAEITTALDLELARVIVGLQLDGVTLRDQAWSRYAERRAAWAAAAADSALVRDVLLADAEDGIVRLRRWDTASHAFIPAEWPDDLGTLHKRILAEHRAFAQKPEGLSIRPSELFGPDGSSLVLPVSPIAPGGPDGTPGRLLHVFGFTIVRLNLPLVEQQILPSLVARYFGPARASDYHVAIVERQGRRVVFEAEPGDATTLARGTDVAVDCFGIGPDHFPLLRQAMASLRLPPRNEPRRGMFFSVFGGRRPGDSGPPRPGDDGQRWRLLVRHRAGSLEAAVSRARWRNLGLSFGILMLMTVSVGLIVIAARRAQALARQQMEFVAGVSHELRTPVSVIAAAADNLAQGVVTEAGRVKQYGSTIQTEARRLADTVERVLQFAGIQAGRASGHRVAVSPVEIVEEALAVSGPAIADAGAALERDVPAALPPVLAEPAALRSALQNLLGNALKYGGRSPWVRVSAREARTRRGREVQFVVEDRGLGVPPADLPHIFEPFYRGSEAQSQQIHGNGLGLSIVRSIVEAHGGRVTVTSTSGKGSTFTMHIPAAAAEPGADAAALQILDGQRHA